MGNSLLYTKIKTFLVNPSVLGIKIIQFLSPLFSDKLYIRLLFRMRAGYRLDLKRPETFNAKLQWLKLYYRAPELTQMVDKFEAKKYVKTLIGDEYVIPNLGVWDCFEDINFNELPNQFVLKTTHDQGGVVICRDKNKFDASEAKAKLNKHLGRNFYLKYREWPYKNVKPRIIAEKFITMPVDLDLKDYKFYCFGGKAKIVFVASGRHSTNTTFDFYDIDFNHLDITRPRVNQSKEGNAVPENYEKMVELAERLSRGLPHVRVDFYNIGGSIYFGEFTFFTGSGMKPFHPRKWDYIFGDFLKLPVHDN